jgi:hypothetical protein
MGDIVAGSISKGKRNDGRTEVVCLYLSEANFNRIPHSEVTEAIEAMASERELLWHTLATLLRRNVSEINIY